MAGSTTRTNQPSPTKATNLGWTSDVLKPEAFTAGHIHNHKAAATPEVEAAPAVAPTAEVGDGGHLGAPGPVFWGGTLTSSKMLGG